MRVLYHHRIGSKDGQAVHIEGLVNALREAGHEVVVVEPALTDRIEFGGQSVAIAFLREKLPRAFTELLEIAYNIPAFLRLYRAYRRWRPNVVYERYNLYSLAGAALRGISRTPFLVEVNAPLFDERSRYGGLSLRWIARHAERIAWRSADFILPVTNVLAGAVCAAGADPRRVIVIPNGVSEEFLSPISDTRPLRRDLGIDGRLVLGFVGFVRDWHGVDAVIDVVAERGKDLDLHLLVVGDGPALPDLQRHATRRGVADRVTFAGLVPRTAVRRYIEAFDVALQPNVVPYASPLKLFEYMAIGLPIIAPDTPNIREILRDGETALLIPLDRPDELARAIEKLAHDAGLRRRLADTARQALLDRRLTWRANAERVAALVEPFLQKSSGERRIPGGPQSTIGSAGERK